MAEQELTWQAPVFEAPDTTKLAFVKRCIDMGIAWQNENCNQASLQKAMDILAGKTGGSLSGKWAKFTTGDLKRGILEIVESLSDIRPYWGYSTDNKAFREQSDMMSKVAKSIYMESFVDRAIKDALQYAAVSGAGFIYPFYSRTMFGAGDGELQFMALGQPDVLPVQLPRGKNYQNAYIVTLAIPMGVAEAHARFPEFQAFLKPFAKKKYGRTKGGDALRVADMNRWRMHKIEGRTEQFCDVYFTYILDVRINYGEIDEKGNPVLDEKGNPVGKEMPMGQPGTSWYYTVPYVGQKITRFENGQTVERVATEDDCRVYPQRRLMISSDLALMYDGPGFDWHSMVPVVPFYLDEWAWEDTGYSLFNGTAATQDAIDDLMRSIYRVAMARAKPGKVYNTDITTPDNKGKLTSRQVEAMDPFDPDATWGVDGDIANPVLRPPMPEWCYNVPQWVLEVVQLLQNSIQRQLGHDQIQALEKLRGDVSDPEKLLDAEGPTVMGTSRSMERGFRDLAKMFKFLIIQYLPTRTLMDYVGADGIAPTVFDYDPSTVIPTHEPGELTTRTEKNANGDDISVPIPSNVPALQRAKNFARNLREYITPHSMHYIAQAQYKLNLLALLGKGVPFDPETIAAQFDIPNWGSIDGSTVKEKVFNWAKEQLTEKADLMKMQAALGMLPPPEEGGGGEGGPPAKPGPKPGQPGAGRPASYKEPLSLAQKGIASGGRVVVKSSK